MKRLEDLSVVAARELGGLEATPVLLAKAKLAAAERNTARTRPVFKPVLASCAALVVCVGVLTAALWGAQKPADNAQKARLSESMMDSFAAGDATVATEKPRLAADVPEGSVSMSAGRRSTTRTLFEQGENGEFPLLRMGDMTYRMLASPSGLSDTALDGEAASTVQEFNLEPALGTADVVSNVVAVGEDIYPVKGAQAAMVAARVDGSLRVFQRVSYAGLAVIGAETLADTLADAEDAVSLNWEGVGEITDAATVQALMQTLYDDCDMVSAGMSGNGSLQIGLANGLTCQLLVGDDTVSACGTWSCPAFFEAFHEALGQ